MKAQPVPTHEAFLHKFITETKISNRHERATLKQQFKKKLSHHLNKIEYNHLRQDRFIISQKRIIEKQHDSIEKAKQFLSLRMQKAHSLKKHSVMERNKRAEDDLARWKSVVDKNKQKHLEDLQKSRKIIKNWNDKLSESFSRKATRLENISKNLKEKMEKKSQKVQTLRVRLDNSSHNPENSFPKSKNPKKYKIESEIGKNSRVPTQNILQKRRKFDDEHLKESILKTVNKQQRINQARYTRHYLQQRRKKQVLQKQETIKELHKNNLASLNNTVDERNQLLDKKHSLERSRSFQKASKHSQPLLNTKMDEKDVKQVDVSHIWSANRNYEKLMNQKLKQISSLMRKNRYRSLHQ